jgi:hypothetical protein
MDYLALTSVRKSYVTVGIGCRGPASLGGGGKCLGKHLNQGGYRRVMHRDVKK